MTVVLNGVVNAQSIFPRVGMLGEFKQKSLAGSWEETFTFLDGPRKGEMGTALINYNDDGTMVGSEAGSITFDPLPKHQKDPQTGLVTSDDIGAWISGYVSNVGVRHSVEAAPSPP